MPSTHQIRTLLLRSIAIAVVIAAGAHAVVYPSAEVATSVGQFAKAVRIVQVDIFERMTNERLANEQLMLTRFVLYCKDGKCAKDRTNVARADLIDGQMQRRDRMGELERIARFQAEHLFDEARLAAQTPHNQCILDAAEDRVRVLIDAAFAAIRAENEAWLTEQRRLWTLCTFDILTVRVATTGSTEPEIKDCQDKVDARLAKYQPDVMEEVGKRDAAMVKQIEDMYKAIAKEYSPSVAVRAHVSGNFRSILIALANMF